MANKTIISPEVLQYVQQNLLIDLHSLKDYLNRQHKECYEPISAVLEEEVAIIDSRGDGNCGPRAFIQGALVHALSKGDKTAIIHYLTELYNKYHERPIAGQPEWTREEFLAFIQRYEQCNTPDDLKFFGQHFNCGTDIDGKDIQYDKEIFYLAFYLRCDIDHYWREESPEEERYKIETLEYQCLQIGQDLDMSEFAEPYFVARGIHFDSISRNNKKSEEVVLFKSARQTRINNFNARISEFNLKSIEPNIERLEEVLKKVLEAKGIKISSNQYAEMKNVFSSCADRQNRAVEALVKAIKQALDENPLDQLIALIQLNSQEALQAIEEEVNKFKQSSTIEDKNKYIKNIESNLHRTLASIRAIRNGKSLSDKGTLLMASDLIEKIKRDIKKEEDNLVAKFERLRLNAGDLDLDTQRSIATQILEHSYTQTLPQLAAAQRALADNIAEGIAVKTEKEQEIQKLEEAVTGNIALLDILQEAGLEKGNEAEISSIKNKLAVYQRTETAAIQVKILNCAGHYTTLVPAPILQNLYDRFGGTKDDLLQPPENGNPTLKIHSKVQADAQPEVREAYEDANDTDSDFEDKDMSLVRARLLQASDDEDGDTIYGTVGGQNIVTPKSDFNVKTSLLDTEVLEMQETPYNAIITPEKTQQASKAELKKFCEIMNREYTSDTDSDDEDDDPNYDTLDGYQDPNIVKPKSDSSSSVGTSQPNTDPKAPEPTYSTIIKRENAPQKQKVEAGEIAPPLPPRTAESFQLSQTPEVIDTTHTGYTAQAVRSFGDRPDQFYITESQELYYKDQSNTIYSVDSVGEVSIDNNVSLEGAAHVFPFPKTIDEMKQQGRLVKYLPEGFKLEIETGQDEERCAFYGVYFRDGNGKKCNGLPELLDGAQVISILNAKDNIKPVSDISESGITNHRSEVNPITLLKYSTNSVFAKEILFPMIKIMVLASIIATPLIALGIAAWPYVSSWIAIAIWPILLLLLPYVGMGLAAVIIGVALLTLIIKGLPWKNILQAVQAIPYVLDRVRAKLHAAYPMAKEYRIELSGSEDFSPKEHEQLNPFIEATVRKNHASELQVKRNYAEQRIEELTGEIAELEISLKQLKSTQDSSTSFFKSIKKAWRDSAIKQVESKIAALTEEKKRREFDFEKYEAEIVKLGDFPEAFREIMQTILGETGHSKGSLVISAARSNISPELAFTPEGSDQPIALGTLNSRMAREVNQTSAYVRCAA